MIGFPGETLEEVQRTVAYARGLQLAVTNFAIVTPLPGTDRPDVTGVLWVDPVRGGLRSVEYTWINAPEEARAPGIGGRADFARLGSGGWIVQRWNIRMARPESGSWRNFDGYTDQGGEVLAVLGTARL